MDTVRLEVTKAYPNDSGRTIARLDRDTLTRLGVEPGDTVEIGSATTTAATARRLDRQDWDMDIVRIDGFTRWNSDVGLGEHIEIRKAEPREADHLVLTCRRR